MKFLNLSTITITLLIAVSLSGCASGGPLARASKKSCREINAIGNYMSQGLEQKITGAMRPGLSFSNAESFTAIQTLRGFQEAVIFKGTAPVYAGITTMESDLTKVEKDYSALLEGLQKCYGNPVRTVNGEIKSADFTANDFFITWQSFQQEGKQGYNVIYISANATSGYVPEFR